MAAECIALGVSPGIHAAKNYEPSKRATEISVAPTGLLVPRSVIFPGLTPGATNMPPANAGSLSMITLTRQTASSFLWQISFLNMIADREPA